jgi:sulfoxide reductase heme-binding subunit YedZ
LNAAKLTLFLACLLPLARLFQLAGGPGLGANPVEFVTRSTGSWALILLFATLSVTPLRRLTGFAALAGFRRMLGLFAFFYASLHMAIYVWLDQWFDLRAIVTDVLERPFITIGMLTFVLMLPLALTSNRAMMRRLGRRWTQLHRLVYLVSVLAVLHFWWHKAGKNDVGEPAMYGAAFALLLLIRAWWWWRGYRPRR